MQPILSNSENKQTTISYTMNGGFAATIVQITNTGIGLSYDFFQRKDKFKTYETAAKWALKIMNPTLK